MLGKPTRQLNLVDSALTRRRKRSRRDSLLQKIHDFVDWSSLADEIEPLFKSSKQERPSVPVEYLIRILFLQYLYDLSDSSLEDALLDRLSFQRFVGFGFSDRIPDFTTVWRFRRRLEQAGIQEKLFDKILRMIEERGSYLKKGRMTTVDATIELKVRKAPKNEQSRLS